MGPPNTENPTERDSKRKWRLSNLLSPGHKETKEAQQPEVDSVPNGPHDSAYGGSEVNSSAPNSEQNVPTITNAEASAQGAAVKTETDKVTGRIVTTTTTTTTTTVTTINGDQYQVPAGSDVVVTRDETSTQLPTELSARPLSRELREEEAQRGPPIPKKSNNRRSVSPKRVQSFEQSAPSPLDSNHPNFSYPARTPPPQAQTPHQQQQSPFLGGANAIHNNQSQSGPPQIPHPQFQRDQSPFIPQIPQRYGSAAPGQQEQPYQAYHPPNSQNYSPVAQNSSRPRPPVEPSMGQPRVDGTPRNPMAYSGAQQRADGRVSTVQNLKTAAAGIHGAGETLRGVINSTVDRRTGAPQETLAKNDAVINRGRMEIETGKYQHQTRPEPVVQQDHLSLPQDREKRSRFRNVLRKSKDGLGPVSEERA